MLAENVLTAAHKRTIHGGILMTITNVRSIYWIPSVRKLAKFVIHKCYGCKKYTSLPYPQAKLGSLSTDRTEPIMPFKKIGRDYVGPIYYQPSPKKERRAYMLLFSYLVIHNFSYVVILICCYCHSHICCYILLFWDY